MGALTGRPPMLEFAAVARRGVDVVRLPLAMIRCLQGFAGLWLGMTNMEAGVSTTTGDFTGTSKLDVIGRTVTKVVAIGGSILALATTAITFLNGYNEQKLKEIEGTTKLAEAYGYWDALHLLSACAVSLVGSKRFRTALCKRTAANPT